jgi:hypothetical protein
MSRTPEYKSWDHMRGRCLNPRNRAYPRYGGRGIKICERWANSFSAFYEDMGPKPELGHTIDRIDNEGDYEPGNCRWADLQTQLANRDSPYRTRPIEYRGETLSINGWAKRFGLHSCSLSRCLKRGMALEEAVTFLAEWKARKAKI